MTDATFRFALVYRLSEIPAVFQFRIRELVVSAFRLTRYSRAMSFQLYARVGSTPFLQLAILHYK